MHFGLYGEAIFHLVKLSAKKYPSISIHLIRRVTIHTSMTEAIETNRQGIQGSQGALTVALFSSSSSFNF